jgi:hypothetical protein
MIAAGFEPASPAIKRLYTYALDSTVTGIGRLGIIQTKMQDK